MSDSLLITDSPPKDELGFGSILKEPVYLALFVGAIIITVVLLALIIRGIFWLQYQIELKRAFDATLIKGDKLKVLLEKADNQKLDSEGIDDKLYVTDYQGSKVVIKKLHISPKVKMPFSKPLLKELRLMDRLQNKNINRFFGACFDLSYRCLVTEYCVNGSLDDVIGDPSRRISIDMKYSFIRDVVNGMAYLHDSAIGSHGRLTSSNCLVNEQFVVKITGFGLAELHDMEDTDFMQLEEHAFYHKKLWTAPELLRMSNRPYEGTQSGDVYSFAIILPEILYRCGPFYRGEDENPSPREIAYNVARMPKNKDQLYRPILLDIPFDEKSENVERLIDLMHVCWAENPEDRPRFSEIQHLVSPLCDRKDFHPSTVKLDHDSELNVDNDIQKNAEKKSLLSENP